MTSRAELFRSEARRRRAAADAALGAYLNTPKWLRDPWLLAYAERDLQIAFGLEELAKAEENGYREEEKGENDVDVNVSVADSLADRTVDNADS
jgi:hypothetical protein